MFWNNLTNWKKAAYNTLWCLIGCSIGDFGTILYFQMFHPLYSVTSVIMALALVNGLITSVILETFILRFKNSFNWSEALKVAVGMSLYSMIAMEVAMNIIDVQLTGGAILTLWVLPVMLIAGFLTPLPYNYWRLEKHGKSCH